MSTRRERIHAAAAAVPDPEIPVVTLAELGILRGVSEHAGRFVVSLTPTYSGCPATDIIAADVRAALARIGETEAEVRIVLSPAWTTDWIDAQAREKLRAWGIAPPAGAAAHTAVRFASSGATVRCPRCGSRSTERLAEFGSTPCKALYRCLACREPFDYFKPY